MIETFNHPSLHERSQASHIDPQALTLQLHQGEQNLVEANISDPLINFFDVDSYSAEELVARRGINCLCKR